MYCWAQQLVLTSGDILISQLCHKHAVQGRLAGSTLSEEDIPVLIIITIIHLLTHLLMVVVKLSNYKPYRTGKHPG